MDKFILESLPSFESSKMGSRKSTNIQISDHADYNPAVMSEAIQKTSTNLVEFKAIDSAPNDVDTHQVPLKPQAVEMKLRKEN